MPVQIRAPLLEHLLVDRSIVPAVIKIKAECLALCLVAIVGCDGVENFQDGAATRFRVVVVHQGGTAAVERPVERDLLDGVAS